GPNLFTFECHERIFSPEYRATERMVRVEVLAEDVEDDVVGRVFDHLDLFEYDVALFIEFDGIECGRGDQIGDQFKRARQMFINNFVEKAPDFAPGKSVHVPAERVRLSRDLRRRTFARAFEQRVFYEMCQAMLFNGFVARTAPQEYAEAN